MIRFTKYYMISIAVVSITCVVLFLPIRFSNSIESFGKIIPIRQWILAKGADGELITSMIDNKAGVNEGYNIIQISRGETMRFRINSSIVSDGSVAAGDTIGTVYSSDAEERLTALQGQLLTARAELAVGIGGRKESVVREVEQRLAYAREDADKQQRNLDRLQQLFEKELISIEEYEEAQGKANLLRIEIAIVEAELEAVTTGEKSEQINLFHSRIEALEQEIAILCERMRLFSIISPLAGKVSRCYSSDTLLIVSDVSEYVALIPVKLSDCSYVSQAQRVSIGNDGSAIASDGKLLALDNEIHFLNKGQIRMATALLTEPSDDLFSGMVTQCKILCEPVTMREYVLRYLCFIIGMNHG